MVSNRNKCNTGKLQMQVCYLSSSDPSTRFDLPDEDEELLPGVLWGRISHFFTPAYWAARARIHERLGTYGRFKTGRTLVEEYAHCLLGGHGMPAEVGWAACLRVCASGLLETAATAEQYERLLAVPLDVAGRLVRYRFPRRKGWQLAAGAPSVAILQRMHLDDLALRARLMELPGVGPKTASWIVRNDRTSDQIAIIDVHITRAGKRMGLFPRKSEPTRDYFLMEEAFLAFARAIGTRASILDHMMWDIMRRIG